MKRWVFRVMQTIAPCFSDNIRAEKNVLSLEMLTIDLKTEGHL